MLYLNYIIQGVFVLNLHKVIESVMKEIIDIVTRFS